MYVEMNRNKNENVAYQISLRIHSIQSLVKPLVHVQTTTIKYLNSNALDSNKHLVLISIG